MLTERTGGGCSGMDVGGMDHAASRGSAPYTLHTSNACDASRQENRTRFSRSPRDDERTQGGAVSEEKWFERLPLIASADEPHTAPRRPQSINSVDQQRPTVRDDARVVCRYEYCKCD